MEIKRNRTSNEISHSAKANLRFGVPPVSPEGFTVTGQLLYHKKTKTDESNSSTVNSNNGEELNRSASRTYGDSDDITANVNLEAKYYLDKKDKHQIRFGGDIGYDGSYGNSSQSSVIRFSSTSEDHGILYTNKSDKLRLNGYMNYNVSLSRYWLLLASAAAAYYTVQDNKDAKNAVDCSQNDYYSRNATDKRANLRQTISIRYQGRGDGNSFSTDFGLCIYEDNITHFSKALIAKQFESSNNCWQLSAGPQLGMSLRKGSWRYSFFSSGKSVVPQYGETSNTIPDFSNPIDISIGNIYLKTSYHQDAKLSVSCGSRNAGNSFFDIRLSGAMDLNKITKASWFDRTAIRYSIPVNAKSPSFNAILNATYLKSLNKKKSLNLTIVPKVNFSTGTIYVSDSQHINISQEKFNYSDMIKNLYGDKSGNKFYSGRSGFIENRTQNLNWVMNAGLKYELLKCSITSGATAANTIIWYSKFPNVKVNNWRYNAYAEALWQSNKGWELEGRFEANWRHGFSNNYNRPVWLLNMRIAKEIKSFTVSLSMYDLLGSSRSYSHVSTAEYIEDTYMSNRRRCILAGISYNFGKWNLGKKTRMELIEKERNL